MLIEKATSLGILSAARKTQSNYSKVLEKLSTGLRINRASDDASGLSVSEEMRTQIRGYQAANVNIDYAQAAQSIAEGTGNETTSILQRQRELALQASNGTLNQSNRDALNQEYQQLNAELTRISGSAQFNTQNVANGQGLAAGGGQVLAGPNPGSELPIQGADFTAANLGTAATDISNPANAQNALTAVDNAIKNVSSQRTDIGANMNRMEFAAQANTNAAINTQDAESRLRDQDFAEGVMQATRDQLLNQSALLSLRNFNEISRNNMMALLQ
ncbi:MAG: flagellin [Fibrobacterota bacterium]